MDQQKLPDLPYDFSALEPVISGQIMELHYDKHHRGYVNNLNLALEQFHEAEKKQDLTKMISLQSAIQFNGGGHINHSIFWSNLAPLSKGGGSLPKGILLEAIQKDFGGLDQLIQEMTTKTISIQGSGWGWLALSPKRKSLQIVTCPNQEPVGNLGLIPLLGIDVWEHAYYLQYKNVRADYVKEIWKLVNWANVEARYQDGIKG